MIQLNHVRGRRWGSWRISGLLAGGRRRIFSFKALFHGSMGNTKLNKPMTGMVPYGDAYLMVAEDGGVFNFSNEPFSGSLGNNPPASPIVAIIALT